MERQAYRAPKPRPRASARRDLRSYPEEGKSCERAVEMGWEVGLPSEELKQAALQYTDAAG
jgi:hypothetical protein